MTFSQSYKQELNMIRPSQALINRTKNAMMQELSKNSMVQRQASEKTWVRPVLVGLAVAATVTAVAVSPQLLTPTADLFTISFTTRIYARELQPDGTIALRPIDIAQANHWSGYHDGEHLFVGLGLWFDFEGDDIQTIELSVPMGFLATQVIGQSDDFAPQHFVNGILVMDGTDFAYMGDTLRFEHYMPEDVLLFWAVEQPGDWYVEILQELTNIDIHVTFTNGEVQSQQIDFALDEGRIGFVHSSFMPYWNPWHENVDIADNWVETEIMTTE